MGRAPCCDKATVKRGPWSPDEDAALKAYIQKHGTGGNWISFPQKAGLKRCGKSCRLRWLNYLRPDIKHGGFTAEEDNIIFALYDRLGSRTDNDVKNYWNTKLKKKLMVRQANSIRSTSPTPPPPVPQTVKTEANSSINFSMPLQPPSHGLPDQQVVPFSMMSFMEQPDFGAWANGGVVSPSEEVSAASSSVTFENSSSSSSYINWSTTGVGSNDSFLAALGFGDTGVFLGGYGDQENHGKVSPCYVYNPSTMWAASETKAQGLCQSLTYS